MFKILVVEDDNTIRKSISKTIRDYGKDNGYKVDVEECEDGFECLYKIYIGFSKNHKYKCIITDDQMRFLNGTFMAYLIHLLIEDRILYPVHIYLASSNTFPKDLFRGIKLFNDVFGKPLTKLQISQVFREFEGEGVINELNDVEEDDDERNDVFKEEDYEADEEEEEDEDNY
jgi:CheY-like chemotaxis protein